MGNTFHTTTESQLRDMVRRLRLLERRTTTHQGSLPVTVLTIEDLNDVTTPGVYYQPLNVEATSGRNYPPGGQFAGVLEVWAPGSNMVFQQYHTYAGSNQFFYRAWYNTTGWSTWGMALRVEEDGSASMDGQLAVHNATNGTGRVILTTSATTNGGGVYFSTTDLPSGGDPYIRADGSSLQIVTGDRIGLNGGPVDIAGNLVVSGFTYLQGSTDTTNSPNVYMSTSERMYRSTSAARAKLCTGDISTSPETLLDTPVRDWVDKGEAERHAEEHGVPLESLDLEAMCGLEPDAAFRRIPGLVAEELESVGLGQFVTYEDDPDNPGQMRTSGVMYDRLWTLLIPLTKELRDKVVDLEDQVATQQATIDSQQAAIADLIARVDALEGAPSSG